MRLSFRYTRTNPIRYFQVGRLGLAWAWMPRGIPQGVTCSRIGTSVMVGKLFVMAWLAAGRPRPAQRAGGASW